MFSRISNAWSLAKSSWAVLQHDRELAWLPVVGGIAGLVVGALFFGPVLAMLGGGSDNAIPAAGYLLMFLGYVATSAIFMWSRAAVIHGANLRMEGGDPTVASSLRGATAHWPAVTGFAAVSVTIGLVLNAIQENGGILGSIVAWIGDVAWSVITYLVLPVVIIEGVGAVEGIKRSTSLVKRTWGEQITANVGFGLLGFALILPGIALVALVGPAGGLAAVLGVVVAVVWILTVAAVMSTLTGIFQTALYRQATGRAVAPEFDQAALAASFRRP